MDVSVCVFVRMLNRRVTMTRRRTRMRSSKHTELVRTSIQTPLCCLLLPSPLRLHLLRIIGGPCARQLQAQHSIKSARPPARISPAEQHDTRRLDRKSCEKQLSCETSFERTWARSHSGWFLCSSSVNAARLSLFAPGLQGALKHAIKSRKGMVPYNKFVRERSSVHRHT